MEFLPPEEFKFCTRFGNREPYSKLTFRGFRYFCTGGQWLQTHLPQTLMLSLPSLVFLPSLCVFGLTEMDPQWGDANFAEVHSKLYDEIMSSIQLVFGHFSDGVRGLPAERLGQAMRILGMNPTEDQDLWPQIEAFVEVLMRKSHLPGPACDSLVMFGLLNCLRFELPQGLQTLGRSWSPIHRPSDVSPFHPGPSDGSGMVQFT